jgi:hypothetical protein
VHFVALARPARMIATLRTHRERFVALARPALMIATFVPYSQHFVALPTAAATIATKRWLPNLLTQSQLTFAGAYSRPSARNLSICARSDTAANGRSAAGASLHAASSSSSSDRSPRSSAATSRRSRSSRCAT